MTDLGQRLLALAAASRSEFVMCAPFAKEQVVTRVLSAVPDGVSIRLYTRWRPEEVAAGVSDTRVLKAVETRGGFVYLYDRLHAKYYRNESEVLIGSANLTATALGWITNPNLEILDGSSFEVVESVERTLVIEAVAATEQLAREVDEIASLLPSNQPTTVLTEQRDSQHIWLPQLRMPSDLYAAYTEGAGSLATRSGKAALSDLAVLELPAGLDRNQFDLLVGSRLRSQAIFAQIDSFLLEPKRFGEMSQLLGRIAGLHRDEAREAWQTVMRWMFEFMPDRYKRYTARHSEIVSRQSHETGG